MTAKQIAYTRVSDAGTTTHERSFVHMPASPCPHAPRRGRAGSFWRKITQGTSNSSREYFEGRVT